MLVYGCRMHFRTLANVPAVVVVMERYRFLSEIGRGCFGVVSLYESLVDGRQYVIKCQPMTAASKSERDSCLRECALLAELQHPYIVAYREAFLHEMNLCIVMDFAAGGDLSALIAKRKASDALWPEDVVLDWFVQLALALQYCHTRRILHRDIKSNNVFLSRSMKVRLGDFGIARVLSSTSELAQSVVGTPYSMSPEVCQSQPYSYASDVWALGCVLYELLTLTKPFDADNLLGLVWKIVKAPLPPLPQVYSADVGALVQRLLSKDPTERPTIKEILNIPIILERVKAQIERIKSKSTATASASAHSHSQPLPQSVPPLPLPTPTPVSSSNGRHTSARQLEEATQSAPETLTSVSASAAPKISPRPTYRRRTATADLPIQISTPIRTTAAAAIDTTSKRVASPLHRGEKNVIGKQFAAAEVDDRSRQRLHSPAER